MQNSNKGDSVPKSTGYKEITTLEEHGDGVRDICFLKDRQLLVSVS